MIDVVSNLLLQDLLELAKRLAVEAAGVSLPKVGQASSSLKADASPVTETDIAIQTHILNAIAQDFPDHAVCTEEAIDNPADFPVATEARFCWVVDPLDGTRNYASGVPCFSTSLAVLDRGRPVVGVVFEHNQNLLYTAVAGMGATFNGTAICVEEPSCGSDILVGIPSSKDQLTVDVLCDWIRRPGLVARNLGSTALHLALVASGALSAAFCKRSKIWDIAAGALLVTEGGGLITDLSGAERMSFDLAADPDADLPVLAAASQTHRQLLATIQTATRATAP
jgi:myo-inositol-1(or 4)-monophosphatase